MKKNGIIERIESMTDIEFCTEGEVKISHSKVFKRLKRIFNFKNLFTTHNSQFTKAIAFTLAETLIVMGIIGVVAALTLPNLNSSTGDKEKVAKVKKIYQNLNDTLGRAEAVYGPFDEWFINDGDDDGKHAKRFGERMVEFMKISKDCDTTGEKKCFTSGKLKLLNGDYANGTLASPDKDGNAYRIITADGTSMLFHSWNNGKGNKIISIDIDGPNKGSFTLGKDIFHFELFKKENGVILGAPGMGMPFSEIFEHLCINKEGETAAAWIINYDNMDYLKIKDGKCPNNNVPTESNPRCK